MKVKLLYVGFVQMDNGDIRQRFLRDGKEELAVHYSGIRHVDIGQWYCGERKNKITYMSRRPEWYEKGEEQPKEKLEEWTARDIAARQAIRRRRDSKTFRRNSEVVQALKVLQKHAKGLGYSARRNLVEWAFENLKEA